jgi:hypothetical protein
MNENSNVVRLRHPDEIDDPLTNILRSGARQLLAQAIELEAEAFLAEMKGFRYADGRDAGGDFPSESCSAHNDFPRQSAGGEIAST